jgi:hypothetical protein
LAGGPAAHSASGDAQFIRERCLPSRPEQRLANAAKSVGCHWKTQPHAASYSIIIPISVQRKPGFHPIRVARQSETEMRDNQDDGWPKAGATYSCIDL